MRKRIFPHIVLILALLCAQQAGFVHALGHMASGTTARTQGSDGKSAPPAKEQAPHRTQACLQCLAVTLSDGVVDAGNQAGKLIASGVAPSVSVESPQAHTASISFLARAPPAAA